MNTVFSDSMNYESSQYKMKIIIDAVRNSVNTRQRHGESLTDYLGRFKATKDVFLSHVGKDFSKLIKEDTKYDEIKSDTSLTDEQVKTEVALVAQKVLEEVITYLFMNNADQVKYGSLVVRLNTSESLA